MDDKFPTFEQVCDPAWRRAQLVTEKIGAMWTAFLELGGLINKSELARQYFGKSQAWLSQRINGLRVKGKLVRFTEGEYHQLAEAMRDIARRLLAHADEIDAAAMEARQGDEAESSCSADESGCK